MKEGERHLNTKRRFFNEAVKHLLLLAAAAVTLIPLVWMAATSFKTPENVFNGPMFWPGTFNLEGYVRVLREVPFFRWTANSTGIAVVQISAQIFVGVLAAYAFSHYHFPGKNVLFFFVLMTMMIPAQVTMIPTYMIVHELGWLNSFKGVIIPHIASGYAIFLLRQSFLTVPRELADTARIDGCNAFWTMWHVYIRLSVPVISALAVIQIVGVWNDYQWPLLILTDNLKQPLPLALIQFRQEQSLDYVPTMAVATLSMLPVIVLFLVAQRRFVEGFIGSGLKG